jgi:hypothetical protein
MDSPRDFSETFRTISDAELLDILDNPANYQPAAVEAARKEMRERKLTDRELEVTRELNAVRFAEENRTANRIKEVKAKMSDTGRSFFTNLYPKKDGETSGRSPEKMIRLVSLCYGLIIIYSIVVHGGSLLDFIGEIPRYPQLAVIVLLPLTILVAGTIGFWKKKPWGWVLLTAFVSFNMVLTLLSLMESFRYRHMPKVFAQLLRAPQGEVYIVQFIVLVGTLFIVCKPKLREIFRISEKIMLATMAAGLSLAVMIEILS